MPPATGTPLDFSPPAPLRSHRLALFAVLACAYRAWSATSAAELDGGVLARVTHAFVEAGAGKPRLRQLVGDLVGLWLLRLVLTRVVKAVRYAMFTESWFVAVRDAVGTVVADVAEQLPVIGDKVKKEFSKVEAELEHEIKGKLPQEERLEALPPNGWDKKSVLARMEKLREPELARWQNGYVSGAVYHGGEDMLNLQVEAIRLYSVTNPLHADLWPSVTKFEAETVAMTAALVNGGDKRVCGAMTSGGTESIIMAAKTHREWARVHKNITEPEIVAPENAHAAIDKACEMLGIKLIHAPVDPVTRRVDVSAVRARMSPDTIMIYSSAPSFPHGIVDPIEELSNLALEFGVGLHVDCCLGGFVLPFAKMLGPEYDVGDRFDFSVPGVTSMSTDLHKFGYASKGTSVVLYRSNELRRFMYFVYPRWPGGLYTTPSTAGSRPGALIAAAWASLVSMGVDGYCAATKSILDAAKKIRVGVERIPELRVIGEPKAMIVGFATTEASKLDIYRVGQRMTKLGWSLNMLQRPASAHVCVTVPLAKAADRFLTDLAACVAELKAEGGVSQPGESAPVYGVAAALPSGPINKVLYTFNDVVLKV